MKKTWLIEMDCADDPIRELYVFDNHVVAESMGRFDTIQKAIDMYADMSGNNSKCRIVTILNEHGADVTKEFDIRPTWERLNMNKQKNSTTVPAKVFIVTKCQPFQPEIYVGVAGSKKAGERILYEEFPKMRVNKDGTYQSDIEGTWLMFVREETVRN